MSTLPRPEKSYGIITTGKLTSNETGELVDFIYGEFQPENTKTCQIRQEVITHYGNQKGSGAVASLFARKFGSANEDPNNPIETRTMLMRVPENMPDGKGGFRPTTLRDVEEVIHNESPNARLRKILSSEPIVGVAEAYAISQGNVTLEDIAERQLTRDAEGNAIISEKTGKQVYRTIRFSDDYTEEDDEDRQVYPEEVPAATQMLTMTPTI